MQPDAPIRRITTWLAILGYMLVASGLPLPLGRVAPPAPGSAAAKRLAGKDRSRPFPCMDKPCGCATAEQCFTRCCCNTPAETLAWAKAHAVEPAVLAALARRAGSRGQAAASLAPSSCCSTKVPAALVAEESCCGSRRPPISVSEGSGLRRDDRSPAVGPVVCEDIPADGFTADESPHEEGPSQEPRSRSVTLRAMLACGGIVAEWFAAGAALPPPRVDPTLAMRVLEVCMFADEACESPASSPTAPPPRAA